MGSKYFFDTCALIEINKANPSYEKYRKDINIILNRLNILEYVYFLIREKKEEEIKEAMDVLTRFNVDYDNEILLLAAKMKNRFLKEKLSFVDCIGYYLAKKNGAKFLTSDEKFKDKDNVEFVK